MKRIKNFMKQQRNSEIVPPNKNKAASKRIRVQVSAFFFFFGGSFRSCAACCWQLRPFQDLEDGLYTWIAVCCVYFMTLPFETFFCLSFDSASIVRSKKVS